MLVVDQHEEAARCRAHGVALFKVNRIFQEVTGGRHGHRFVLVPIVVSGFGFLFTAATEQTWSSVSALTCEKRRERKGLIYFLFKYEGLFAVNTKIIYKNQEGRRLSQ